MIPGGGGRSLLAALGVALLVSMLAAAPASAGDGAVRQASLAEPTVPHPPAMLSAPPLSPRELGDIAGRAGGYGLSAEVVPLPGVRLWDEWTPPAHRPAQNGEVTVNGVRVR